MKKTLLLICLLTFNLTIFSQNMPDAVDNKGVDYLILEMKLGAILGGFKNGKFVKSEVASKGAVIGEDYTLFGLDVGANEGVMKLKKVHEPELEMCPDYYAIETEDKADSGVALSSNARWNATPRIPQKLDVNNNVYKNAVRKVLQDNGIKTPNVNIGRILKVDLEGDKVDEVLIEARYRKKDNKFSTTAGDYSIVLLRKIVDGKVKNILLGDDIKKKSREDEIPYEFELSSILDLDADGKMEIVVYGSYYEGAWVTAYQIKDGKEHKILETGCGV